MNATLLHQLLSRHCFAHLDNEKRLQDEIAEVMTANGYLFKKEHKEDDRNIFDFLMEDGTVVEVKIKGSKRAIYKQLERYAELQVCKAIIIVSTVSFGLPLAINGKPSYNVQLGKSWL